MTYDLFALPPQQDCHAAGTDLLQQAVWAKLCSLSDSHLSRVAEQK
jgi:hypothetical protein